MGPVRRDRLSGSSSASAGSASLSECATAGVPLSELAGRRFGRGGRGYAAGRVLFARTQKSPGLLRLKKTWKYGTVGAIAGTAWEWELPISDVSGQLGLAGDCP